MRARSWLLAVLLLSTPAASFAQPEDAPPPEPDQPDVAPPQSTEEQAAAAFDQGKQAFLEDDYERALASFEEAQRLAPHDVVRFNIALCLERLGRFRRALEEYEHAAASNQLDAANRADAAQRAERVRPRLGTVVVAGPAGARVEIVGIEQCAAPCRVPVDPGPQQVRLVDHPSETRSVTVERGAEATVDFTPAPPPPEENPLGGLKLRVGLIGWVGAGVAVVGTLCTIAFGIRAGALHDEYLDDPTIDRRDAGRTAVVVTNVSLVFAILGAAALAVDVLVLEPRRQPPAPPATERMALLRF